MSAITTRTPFLMKSFTALAPMPELPPIYIYVQGVRPTTADATSEHNELTTKAVS